MRSSLAARLAPFWLSTEMTAEPLVFLSDADDSVSARLLFSPSGEVIITNGAGDRHYTEGSDYVLDRVARRLWRTPGSRIPFVDPAGGAPRDVIQVQAHTSIASYAHADDAWRGDVPAVVSPRLPRTRDRLENGQPLCLGVLGDSISEGYDASGFHGVTPRQPPYARLVADGLTLLTGMAGCDDAPVTLCNLAVAGSTAEDGRWLAADMAACKPDLVIVAFGMNDAGYAEPQHFAANIADIMRRVAEARVDTEFILVAPMRPTRHCTWVDHGRFTLYRGALRELTRAGVAIADVTAVWDAVLTRKHEYDLSGNGSNHPNDFGHRLYAQTVLQTIGCSARLR